MSICQLRHDQMQQGPNEPHTGCGTFLSLSKHGQGQKNNGHTGSSCLDNPVLVDGFFGFQLCSRGQHNSVGCSTAAAPPHIGL